MLHISRRETILLLHNIYQLIHFSTSLHFPPPWPPSARRLHVIPEGVSHSLITGSVPECLVVLPLREREEKKETHTFAQSHALQPPNGEPLGSGSFVYIPRRAVTRRRPRRSSAPPTQASAETPHVRLARLISRRRAAPRPPSASRLLSRLRGLIASLSVACRR